MKKRIAALFLVLLWALTACGDAPTSDKSDVLVFRYADNQPNAYPTSQAAYKFAQLVNERTDGRIQIIVYTDAQLGDEVSVIEQVQLGMIDFARASVGTLGEFNKELSVLQMPYLYEDADQMWRVLDGDIGDRFLNGMADYGMVGLSWFDAGARSFYNNVRPITKLEDIQGMRIRVQESSLMMDTVRALGAEPVMMVYSDVYSGLQSGAIDGAENNWPSYESMGHYEVAKYYVLNQHMRVPEIQLASKATMDRLSDEDRAVLRQAALESAQYERQLWKERETESEEKIRASGAVITELTDSEREKFRDAMQPLYDTYCADYMDIVNAIRAS